MVNCERRAAQGHVAIQDILLPFGKHKGKLITQVHDGYLQWMQAASKSSWWRERASEVLQQRKLQQEAKSERKKIGLCLLADLKMCDNLERGRKVHAEAVETGNDSNSHVATALLRMYAKCGSMAEARKVFDGMNQPDVVAWTALISGYAENGEGSSALDMFARMLVEGCAPDSFAFVSVLKACASLAIDPERSTIAIERGEQIHSEIGCHLDIFVQSSLIDMYAKFGKMVDAHGIFDTINQPDVVAWTSLISGYADNEEGGIALRLFATMRSQGFAPNSFTFVAALKACGSLGALECGRKVHAEIKTGARGILFTCLVDFYAKCGCLAEAQRLFETHDGTKDFTTWNALLAGYSRLGESEAVFRLFDEMQDAGFQPNRVTFLSLLTCCSHAGLVEKANDLLKAMLAKYEVAPGVEHYSCMADMLGRSNKLEDALALLRDMPCRANAVTWKIVLSNCRKRKNLEVGRLAFKSLVSLDETIAAAYVLLAQIYRSRGMLKEQDMVLGMREKFRVSLVTVPGQSCWTNELGEAHKFLDGLEVSTSS